jgi:hypothetical protein
MAKIYYANGESKEIAPANGVSFTAFSAILLLCLIVL